MPSSTQIQPQDPSTSPTYSLSRPNISQPPVPPSLRRNLFSAHLSRRPVPSQAIDPFIPTSPVHEESSQQDLFTSQPSLQPTQRTMNLDMQDMYNPNISPSNHPLSPSTAAQLFPSSSIIAVHPLTGRPLLPAMPTLPSRLRLSEGDDDDDDNEEHEDQDSDMEDNQHHIHPPSADYHHPGSGLDYDLDLDSSTLQHGTPYPKYGLQGFMDVANEEPQRDRERIERILAEMQTRQRARARQVPAGPSSESVSHSTITGSTSSARRGKARAVRTDATMLSTSSGASLPHGPPPASSTARTTGDPLASVGTVLDPAEKDELMSLIMTSLRKKAQMADEENWMYGIAGQSGLGGLSEEIGFHE